MLGKVFLYTSALIIGFHGYAHAQEAEATPAPAAQQESAENVDERPLAKDHKELLSRVVDVSSKLDQAQASHFFVMYSNYSIISMVKNVEKDIGEAVKKCGDEHASMKSKVDSRFTKWQETVHAAMTEAQGNMDNMAQAQDYMSQSDLKHIFTLIDNTRLEADSRFQRVPLTTPEACEYMLTQMDESEVTMDKILRATLASYPAVLQKTQQ